MHLNIYCGASAVQIGTQYVENTPCFDRISNELLDIMESKNYKNINEFKGKIIQYYFYIYYVLLHLFIMFYYIYFYLI